jgi:hypothetical protein
LVTRDNEAFQSPTTAQTQTLCTTLRAQSTAHWHICLPLMPPRHQSKQKSQPFPYYHEVIQSIMKRADKEIAKKQMDHFFNEIVWLNLNIIILTKS